MTVKRRMFSSQPSSWCQLPTSLTLHLVEAGAPRALCGLRIDRRRATCAEAGTTKGPRGHIVGRGCNRCCDIINAHARRVAAAAKRVA